MCCWLLGHILGRACLDGCVGARVAAEQYSWTLVLSAQSRRCSISVCVRVSLRSAICHQPHFSPFFRHTPHKEVTKKKSRDKFYLVCGVKNVSNPDCVVSRVPSAPVPGLPSRPGPACVCVWIKASLATARFAPIVAEECHQGGHGNTGDGIETTIV